jgi:hypothetical protein
MLLFPQHNVVFTPRSVLLTGGEQPIQIDESNFEFLQTAISNICCMKTGPMD